MKPAFPKIVMSALFAMVASYNAAAQTTAAPLFHWRCPSGGATLNHNPAILTGNGAVVFDSVPYAKDYTMIVVYKPVAGVEMPLWTLSFGDAVRGMTTERILIDSAYIRYEGRNDGRPVVSTLRQSSPDSTMPYARLVIGPADTASATGGNMKVAEVLYYSGRMGNAALRKIQSRLAIRYGLTLEPVDYIDATGRHVWDCADSGRYHHRVTGVAKDTLSGLFQPRSRSEVDGAVLTISADSLHNGAYLIVGDDDMMQVFVREGSTEVLMRRWKAQATSTEGMRFTLKFDTREFAVSDDSLVLLVDSLIYLPYSVCGDSVVFEGVEFPSGSSFFTLGRGSEFWQLAQYGGSKGQSGQKSGNHDNVTDETGHFSAKIYPNPSLGHYTIEVDGSRQVQVTVYNVQGVIMASFSADGSERHVFEGNLPTGEVYYATIVTDNGSQTVKLAVK